VVTIGCDGGVLMFVVVLIGGLFTLLIVVELVLAGGELV